MKKYALAGASSRAIDMFCVPIKEEYHDIAEVVGVMDINKQRMKVINSYLQKPVPMYTDYDQMLNETKPDVVIVTTKDCFHHKYIIGALDAGIDVITEKPMTIDDEKCRAILEAEKRNDRKIIVAFNYRHAPLPRRIKELLMEKRIGEIKSVDFHWYLDTFHGADYFRRWHRRMENSGGLIVHKATHHFDLVNWFLDAEPDIVFGHGNRYFYGSTRKERGERCLNCQYKDCCEFYWDLTKNPLNVKLYLEAEKEDGYLRDGCVFSEEIDIYDTINATIRYKNGIQLSYSLITYAPYEGWRMSFNGTKGRLDALEIESRPLGTEGHDFINVFSSRDEDHKIYIYPIFKPAEVVNVLKATGSHAGADPMLQKFLFLGMEFDPLNLKADSWAGAMSILIGVAINKSIISGMPVKIDDLLGEHAKK